MFPSELDALRREVAAKAPTDPEITFALNDLRNHIADVLESIGQKDPGEIGVRRMWELLTSGSLSGKTSRPFRPSFAASFSAANKRKELFPIISLEVVGEEPKATTNAKR